MRRKPLSEEEVADAADRAEGKKPEKHPGGRPPKYQASFADQAAKLCMLGATNVDLADFFEVSIRTVDRWLVEHEEFCRAVNETRTFSDERVERRLYERAMGYTFESEKVLTVKGEVVRVPTREHVPPDVTAAIFWLKNRKPEQWREKQQVEHSGEIKQTLDPSVLNRLTEDELRNLRALTQKMVAADGGGE